MAKKNNKTEKNLLSRLKQETTYSVLGLILLAISLLLFLSQISQAGAGGELVYEALFYLLGWGYILLPLTLLCMSLNFLINKKETPIHSLTWIGAAMFLLSALGLIDVVEKGQGGLFGTITGSIKEIFGNTAWGIILSIASIIGIIIVLDRPLHLKFGGWKKKEKYEISIKTTEIENNKKEHEEKNVSEEKDVEKKEKQIDQKDSPKIKSEFIQKFSDYKAPPLELLKTSLEKPSAGDLRANANIIKRTLESFGISVEMGEINIGPKVTRYTLRPADGVKLSRITALNQDLSLALSAHPIRIEAPIPGKPYVGIEVPNKSAAVVRIGNLLSYPEFSKSGPLGFCIGRDVTGEPIFADIEKMPHLLIAGATGSGKSISLHSILISLLYKNSPQTLRLILIDPKRVELSAYNEIPHLACPVLTEGKKAMAVFKWAIAEMERRYEILLKAGARDIQSYNKKEQSEHLSYLLIVVDEVADLMAAYGREIENSIVRLAQMARATGIHLILSTQRPSVEVITGLIKANITSRIALQVASQVDSRTILDTAGAEKLLGGGDLLFVSAELSKPRRIQGAYVSEEEIKSVTDFIKKNNENINDENEITLDSHGGHADILENLEYSGDDDELLEEAMETVKSAKKASASLLQRRLKIGYARAARLLDIMEERGIIGPGDGAKPRDVYIGEEQE